MLQNSVQKFIVDHAGMCCTAIREAKQCFLMKKFTEVLMEELGRKETLRILEKYFRRAKEDGK